MPTLSQAQITIHGLVQGIFFRAFVQKNAQDLNLTGWAKNQPDGTVAAFAEGKPDDIKKLIQICQKGPPEANVAKVESKISPIPERTFADFTIKY